jgi:lysophospholipase L1-like esterase
MTPKRNQQKYRDIFIGIGLTFLVLLTAEICARAYLFFESSFGFSCRACVEFGQRDYASYSAGYGDLMPNQDGIWTIWPHRPYHVQTNFAGLRNIEPLKEGKDLRILAIGDSFTFGPYMPNEDTWPGWLEIILHQRLKRNTIEVLNAGIAGYTIPDELSYFQDKGYALVPDLVILQFFTNDISDLSPQKRQIFRRPALEMKQKNSKELAYIFNYLALYQLTNRFKSKLQIIVAQNQIDSKTGERTNTESVDITQQNLARDNFYYSDPRQSVYHIYYKQYETDLRTFIREVKAQDSQLVIVAFPEYAQIPINGYPDGPQQFIEKIAKDTATPYLDLLSAFRAAGEIEDLYLLSYNSEIEPDINDPFFSDRVRYIGNGHLSRFGYRVAARSISDFLITEKIIGSNVP